MKVQYSPYSLTKKSRVNAVDNSSAHEGTLVRVLDSENNWGVADLSPWPSLGDLNLKEEIAAEGHLFKRAIFLAMEDLMARKQKKSLLFDKWIDNNILVSDYRNFNFEDSKWQGQTFKLKGDQKISDLLEVLNSVPQGLTFRIDFNSVLTFDQFKTFLDRLPNLNQIEYIEDPCIYHDEYWNKWNSVVPLACDFIRGGENFKVQVIKPAREEIRSNKKIVITSSMDHPVGVAHALRLAQIYAKNKCGLLTLDLYEPTEFHHHFRYRNKSEINFDLTARNDFGIGMTKELLALKWKDAL